jgi:hypothetical protein
MGKKIALGLLKSLSVKGFRGFKILTLKSDSPFIRDYRGTVTTKFQSKNSRWWHDAVIDGDDSISG